MTDVSIYSPEYRGNQGAGSNPFCWHSNADLFGELTPGDRLWLIMPGKSLGREPGNTGFLAAVLQVKEVIDNPGDDPSYRKDKYGYRIISSFSESVVLDEPVVVDHLIRPPHGNQSVSIGRYLRMPRKLSDQKVRLLRSAAGPKIALKWLQKKENYRLKEFAG